ncbi:MAG: site-2 protease family protein [Clostridia bacterium]|nr:site-2 protease family protein [Clostridia bacterium]
MLLDILTSSDFTWEMVFGSILASLILIFLVSPVHELSHAAAALALGDKTPKWQGRITLNPLAHIDYIGSLMILLFGFGWAKPVEVNMRNFKNPKAGMAITALAGPLSNFIIAFIASLFFVPVFNFCNSIYFESEKFAMILWYFFNYFILISISIGIFNLIPIPPLDGSRILSSILPDKYYYQLMRYEQYSFIIFIVAFYALGVGDFLSDVVHGVFDSFTEISESIFGPIW